MHSLKLLAAASLLTVTLGAQAAGLDANLPDYKKASGVSGNLSSVGSDTLANLMTQWAEEFKREYPNVNIQIQAAGSSTAPPALTEGTSNLGPKSRAMKGNEIEAFEKKYGYKPTVIRVAIDALAGGGRGGGPGGGGARPRGGAGGAAARGGGGGGGGARGGQRGRAGAGASRD